VVGKTELLEIMKEKTGLPKKSLESALIALTDTIKEKVYNLIYLLPCFLRTFCLYQGFI